MPEGGSPTRQNRIVVVISQRPENTKIQRKSAKNKRSACTRKQAGSAGTPNHANTNNTLRPETTKGKAKRKRMNVRVGTWNVRTLFQAGKLDQVCREMDRMKMDLLGMQEVRWNQSGENRTRDGKLFLYSGMPEEDDDHIYGVGLLLSRRMQSSLLEWNPVSERLMIARIKAKNRNISVVVSYAPTEDSSAEDKEAFYDVLDGVLERIPKRDVTLLIGDLNARVGANNKGLEHVMGPHGIGQVNENGGLLIECCGNHGLKIGGTMFIHKPCHKNSWISNDNRTTAQLDHVCISGKWASSLLDVRCYRSADIGSDHHLVLGTLRVRFVRIPRKNSVRRKKYDVRKLEHRDIKSQFTQSLRQNLQEVHQHHSVEDQWRAVKESFITVSDKVLGYLQPERKEWMTDDTWKKVEERRAAKMEVCQNTNPGKNQELQQQFNKLNNAVKRSAKRDKRKFLSNLADEAQQAADTGQLSELYKIVNKMSRNGGSTSKPVRDKSGKILVAVEDQLKRWKEHFEETLNHQFNSQCKLESKQTAEIRINSSSPSKLEIVKALKELKNGKAAGVDGIPAEVLKADTSLTADALLPLFTNIWNSETLPADWLQGIIIKIPKKGDLTDCKNWRGINLLCVASKIFSKVILNRIIGALEPRLRKQQAGFRAGRSCIDQINTLRMIFEQSMELNSPLYVVFVDYQVAFDSLDRDCIWIALRNCGLPDKLINVIKSLYNGFKCSVLHDGQLSDPFTPCSGVRQGCVLSPLLFLVVLDEVMHNALDGAKRGILWNLTDTLEDLDFADDIALLSHKFSDMQSKVDSLMEESSKVGLRPNTSKTKEMRLNNRSSESFKINGADIETVDDFTYLGSVVAADGGTPKDISSRINKARATFSKLKNIWRDNNISLKTKTKVFNACVKSVLLYGCETWFVTNNITSKIQSFVNRCLRFILKIWWPKKISNQELWKKTGQVDINLQIKKRKYGWIGHTLRKSTTEICHSALEWNPQGRRKQGRPKATWRRTVLKESGKKSFGELRALAENRTRWRSFADSLCHQE
jgi:endonuclease/exonuclease/phosphatase family metal-dependent hydrolase